MHNKRALAVLSIILILVLASISILTSCSSVPTSPTTSAAPPAQTTQAPAPTTQVAKQVLIRMTTPVPVGDDLAVKAQAMMDKFNAATNGAYKMQMFPGAQLDQPPAMLDDVRSGAVEGGIFPPAMFAGEVPEFGLAELPYMFDSAQANAYGVVGLQPIYTNLLKAKANQVSLGCIFVGGIDLLSKKPIHTLEDLKGLNVGCDTPSSAGLIKALGGNGIVVDFTEDYSNLQKGVIDAKTSGPQYVQIAKLYEVCKNMTVFFALPSVYSIDLNLDVYNKMPPDVQNELKTDMSQLASDLSQYYVTLADTLRPTLTQEGVTFYDLPKAESDRWKALAYPGTLAEVAKYGDIGAQIKAVADAANAKYPYTVSSPSPSQ